MTRIAFLADIHGNLPALEAVLEDIASQSPDAVFLAGDQINRCPWSNEVMDIIEGMGWQAIYGNHELVLRRLAEPHDLVPFDNRRRFPDLWWTLPRLGPHRLDAIRNLPPELALDFGEGAPIRLIHGVPGDPFRGVFLDTDANVIAQAFRDVQEPLVVCGHTHQPLRRSVQRWEILNGGSVGIPYNGDPRAQYLLLSRANDSWTPIYRRVEYPLESVRQGFLQYDLNTEYGPLASIYLRTVETGEPWASDFGHWMNSQPSEVQRDLERAVGIYERTHGPGKWSFLKG